MGYTIAEPCFGTKDAGCVNVCPVDCIHSCKDAMPDFSEFETRTAMQTGTGCRLKILKQSTGLGAR